MVVLQVHLLKPEINGVLQVEQFVMVFFVVVGAVVVAVVAVVAVVVVVRVFPSFLSSL